MSSRTDINIADLSGLRWDKRGQSVLSQDLFQLLEEVDALFLRWANRWQAEEYMVPTFIAASELHKIDYFSSFPQLATFPVSVAKQDLSLEDIFITLLLPKKEKMRL